MIDEYKKLINDSEKVIDEMAKELAKKMNKTSEEVRKLFVDRNLNDSLEMVNDKNNELTKCVKKFMIDNQINCEETIYQCDWVIENAYEFIEELFLIIKDNLPIEDEE